MAPFFSVIVPVYNVEAYLRQCVDSILAQTFGDLELILVDDGSPDGCGAICDEYARQDSRVQVIHQPNAGPVASRKSGLLRAAAEYVCFADSDDWVEPRWLETIRAAAETNDRPDIVVFEHRRDTGAADDPILAQPGLYGKARLEAEIYPYMICDLRRRPFGRQLIPAFVWSRAVRRQLLLARYIPDGTGITHLFEDIAMCNECMYYARSMYIIRQPLYIYRRREQSILSGVRPRYFAEVQACFDYLRSRLGGTASLDRQINAAYLYRVLGGIVREQKRLQDPLQAARSVRTALGRTHILSSLSFAGLPADMKIFLALLKCRLYLAAVLVTRYKM